MKTEFDRWVSEHQHDAWSLARYLLQDRSEAQDAVQEAFIKLWHHRDRLDPGGIRPWLMTVTRNECMDRLRRRPRTSGAAALPLEPVTVDGCSVELREQRQQINRAIGRLGEPYRSIVVLRDVLQHSYAEVAGTTGLTMDQVKVYLFRARRQLRDALLTVKA